jgi:hypothetical protein
MPGELYKMNRQRFTRGCLTGIPTFGVVPIEFALSLAATQYPLNWGGATYVVHGQAVDAARNQIIEFALKDGFDYVFFRDDDVWVEPAALNRLYSLKVPIASAVVYAKQWPTHPMVFKWSERGAYEDWRFGEVIRDADWTGMGCSLIRTDVFRKIEPPWFKTDPGSIGIDHHGNQILTGHTEDAYFYAEAEKAGYKPIVDTGIETQHLDVMLGVRYGWNRAFNNPAMMTLHGDVYVYPPYSARDEAVASLAAARPKAEPPTPFRINLGSGNAKMPGYLNVDLFGEPDERGDCRDLKWLTDKYGLADEITSSHLLEHFRIEQVGGILKNWVAALKPGGILRFSVPDFNWVCQTFLAMSESDPEKYNRKMFEIFGMPGDGMTHMAGLTPEFLMARLKELPLGALELRVHPAGEALEPGMTLRQQEIRVSAAKMMGKEEK